MKLYLVRHGQSMANLTGTYSGQSQVLLTEAGEAQARAAGALLAGIAFDRVYTSDLVRAVRTQELALPGVTAEQTALLREYDVGTLTGQRFADCQTIYGEAFLCARAAGDYSPFGGENRAQIGARARAFLDEVEALSCERVIAFSHRGMLLALLDVVTGGCVPHSAVRCDNCSINRLEYRDGVWQISLWNHTGTL